MQPYTPHGDSNQSRQLTSFGGSGCNLIPLTGTVTFFRLAQIQDGSMMQPYTPHGDSNRIGYNVIVGVPGRCNLIPLTGTVTKNAYSGRC